MKIASSQHPLLALCTKRLFTAVSKGLVLGGRALELSLLSRSRLCNI